MIYDPILENPLDSEMEWLINKIGPKKYLSALMRRFGIKLSKPLEQLTENDCHKAIRGIFRSAHDYEGPETCQ